MDPNLATWIGLATGVVGAVAGVVACFQSHNAKKQVTRIDAKVNAWGLTINQHTANSGTTYIAHGGAGGAPGGGGGGGGGIHGTGGSGGAGSPTQGGGGAGGASPWGPGGSGGSAVP